MIRWRVFLIAMTFPILAHIYMYLMFSKVHSYSQIQLGDPVEKVDDLLSGGLDYCRKVVNLSRGGRGPARCHFSDPWRRYEIALDPATRVVALKYVTWSAPVRDVRPLVYRLVEWVSKSHEPPG